MGGSLSRGRDVLRCGRKVVGIFGDFALNCDFGR